MLLAVAGPARGRSHSTKTGNDASDIYGYYDSRLYYGDNNSSGNPFGSIFDECEYSDYSDEEPSIIHYMTLGIFPLLLVQGIVGNLLAIPVLMSISKSAWSTVMYLACLGGVDLILLLIQCGDAWYQEVLKTSLTRRILDSSDAACKTYHFAYMCVKHLNPWLMVAIAIEMMIATRWPKKTYFMCTLERARNVKMLIGIIIVCLDINHFWTFGVIKPGLPCIYIEDFTENFKDWVWPALDHTVELVLPVVAVSACFFLTATTLMYRPANQKRDMDCEMKNYFLELATLRDFSSICFILCIIFMFLSVCKITYILTVLVAFIGYLDVDCTTLRVFKTIDMIFNFIFFSAKIYLYLTLSATFRAKLKESFNDCCKKLQRCCRIMCVCGKKWTPITQEDKCEKARMVQGTSTRVDGCELAKGCQNDGSNSQRCVQLNDTACGKVGYGEPHGTAGGIDQEEWHGNDISELTNRRPYRNSGGNSNLDDAATKV